MSGFSYLCGLVLAWAFVRAAALKLARPQMAATGFEQLGLAMPRVLARVVPGIELVVAMALVAYPAMGGVLALGLLSAFTLVLVSAVHRGTDAPCTCFGAMSTEPVGRPDILRNLALAGLALASLDARGPEVPSPAALAVVAAAVGAGWTLIRSSRRRSPGRR